MGCDLLTFILEKTLGKPLKTQIDEILFAKNKKKTEYISDIKSQHFLSSSKTFWYSYILYKKAIKIDKGWFEVNKFNKLYN